MFGIGKIMIIFGIIITSLLYWATTNVCRYNFVIEKKTKEMNIIASEIKPEIKLGKVYYFEIGRASCRERV